MYRWATKARDKENLKKGGEMNHFHYKMRISKMTGLVAGDKTDQILRKRSLCQE